MISLQKTISRTVSKLVAEHATALNLGEIQIRADNKKDWDYSSPSATSIYNKFKGQEGAFNSIKEVAELIVSSIPKDHPFIEKADILQVPVSTKGKDKKKKKKEGETEEEEKEVIDTAGPPSFVNIKVRNSFLEDQLMSLI